MWVHFVDLEDDSLKTKCLKDHSGPQDSKYCDDRGVYYTYNFVEDGNNRGHLDYPWGGQQLMPKLGINLTVSNPGLRCILAENIYQWVTEASAKSYRLAKPRGHDPFNVTGKFGTQLFLSAAVESDGSIPLLNQARRYPGSWTLPVCDSSTWGKNWNWDYTSDDYKKRDQFALVAADFQSSKKQKTHPPCLCGMAVTLAS